MWTDMLCLMFESSRRGYLQQANGQPLTYLQLARMTGCTSDEAAHLVQELADAGVCSRTEHGLIYSRRLVRDEHKRELCREAGKKGGNPNLLDSTLKGVPKGQLKGPANLNLTPSSSSSFSTNIKTKAIARFSSSEIESVYLEYPRKVAKADALKAIKKALENLDEEDPVVALRERVREFAESPAGKKGEFVPYPASWFNAKHYLDDPGEWERR
jgi:hypothetical protein